MVCGGAAGLGTGDSVVRAGLVGAVAGAVGVAEGRGASVTATALVRELGATRAVGRTAFCGTNGAGALVLTRAVGAVVGVSHWRINSCTAAL